MTADPRDDALYLLTDTITNASCINDCGGPNDQIHPECVAQAIAATEFAQVAALWGGAKGDRLFAEHDYWLFPRPADVDRAEGSDDGTA